MADASRKPEEPVATVPFRLVRHDSSRPFVPLAAHRELVKAYAAVGVPVDQIAKVVGISASSIRRHFRDELDLGSAEATAKVGGRLFKLAMDGDVAACIFWMKARAGWSERMNVHHTAGSGLSHEERLARLAADPKDTDDDEDEDPGAPAESSGPVVINGGGGAAEAPPPVVNGKAEELRGDGEPPYRGAKAESIAAMMARARRGE